QALLDRHLAKARFLDLGRAFLVGFHVLIGGLPRAPDFLGRDLAGTAKIGQVIPGIAEDFGQFREGR
ncbi:MAG: hypothetical protein UY65_C0029G0008, partial [Parcubacteria group bacterium GW2011_GWA2_51_12]